MKAKMRGQEISADVLKEITNIASNKNNLELFTKKIKSLDEKDYKEIIKFYDTKLGKKNADLARNINSLNMQQEIVKFSKKELSKERKSLISQLVEVSMSEKKTEKIGKVMIQTTIDALPKEMRVKFQEKMDAQMPQIKLKMREETEKATLFELSRRDRDVTQYIYQLFTSYSLKKRYNYKKREIMGYWSILISALLGAFL